MKALRDWALHNGTHIMGFDIRNPLKGGFWLLVSQIVASISALGLMSAFAYLSSPEVFGVYQYIISTAALLGVLTLPGLNQALVRAVAQKKEATFFSVVRIRTWGAILMAGALGTVAGYYALQGDAVLAISFGISAIFIPIMRISETFLPLWQGRSQWRTYASYESVSNALPAILFVPVLFFTDNLLIIIGGYFTAYTGVRGALFLLARKNVQGEARDESVRKFGAHLSVMGLLQMGADQLDKIILWHIAGPAAVAIYSFAFLPIQRLKAFFPIDILALPRISSLDGMHPKRRMIRAFLLLLVLSLGISLLAAFTAPLVYPLFFPGYDESILYFQVLLFTFLIIPFSFLETVLIIPHQTQALYITRSAPLVLRLCLYLFLAPLFGVWGIISATLIATILYALLIFFFFTRS